jgi:protein-S-isoprenylcysteine O-methyltransferase Ste14
MDTVFGWLAVAMWAVFYAVDGLVRGYLHYRATGSAGTGRPQPRPSQLCGGLLAAAGAAVSVVGALLAATGALGPVRFLDSTALRIAGMIVSLTGIGAVFVVQSHMGASWRANVDYSERTELVRTGVFAVVRNPIFTLIVITAVGLALMTPNAVALAGVFAIAVGINLHVRLVEEPYLHHVHGDAYLSYTAQVGRFVPRVGRSRIRR